VTHNNGKDFNRTHPELREGEFFLSNGGAGIWSVYAGPTYKYTTLRKGSVAYNIHGVKLAENDPDRFPIFAQKSEAIALSDHIALAKFQ
jgi:hypothetical protein